MLALFWTMMPLIGWSSYDFEGIGTSCSINWVGRSFNVISYNTSAFIFIYFAPVLIIIITNTKIYRLVRARRHSSATSPHPSFMGRRHRIELRILGTVVFVTGGFLLAWTPYAIIVLIEMFHANIYISPIMITIPALFAKTSFVWNPLILILRDGKFRQRFTFIGFNRRDSNQHNRRPYGTNRTPLSLS